MTDAAFETRTNRRHPAPPPDEAAREGCPAPVDVLIIDDDRGSSYGLWVLLRRRPGIHMCATSGSAGASATVERERPAVCLVSASLGLRFVHRLTQLTAAPRVLAYADRRTAELDGMAVIAGAAGAVWRYSDPVELAAAIRRAAAGHAPPPERAVEAIGRLIDRVEDRDRPIVAMLLLGTPVDEIARTLGISARAFRARRWEIVGRLEHPGRDRAAADAAADPRPGGSR